MSLPVSTVVTRFAYGLSQLPRVAWYLGHGLVLRRLAEVARRRQGSKAVHEQEVVIVGYTEPRSSRKYFGSLVLAVRDKAKKRWVYAGHVGTGFDQAALKSLSETMRRLRTDEKPLDQKVKDESATTWLIPKLVGEVKFTEWTSEGEMRHPAFLGLRTDKKALEFIREQA
jgi:bifunctional non-homologous end joining protein LigD